MYRLFLYYENIFASALNELKCVLNHEKLYMNNLKNNMRSNMNNMWHITLDNASKSGYFSHVYTLFSNILNVIFFQ